jgi:hypothetical protein
MSNAVAWITRLAMTAPEEATAACTQLIADLFDADPPQVEQDIIKFRIKYM